MKKIEIFDNVKSKDTSEISFNKTKGHQMTVVKKPVSIKMELVPKGTEVDTLEGKEIAREECYLCYGTSGDHYFISKEKVKQMYDNVESDTFVKKPIPMYATEMNEAFEVPSPWSANEVLKGKPGDFLMESLTDEKDKYPIDRTIFFETYVQISLEHLQK